MAKRNIAGLAALIAIGLMCVSASGKTKLIQSWADPSAADYRFSKVIAVAVIENADVRRMAEAAIVKNIKRFQAIPSCTVLQKEDERDRESAKRRMRDSGFDGAVVLRLLPIEDKVQYVAPSVPDPYTSYYSYTLWAWPVVSAPGYLKHDRILQVETLFYSIKDDRLLWSGVCESSNPKNPQELIAEMAKVIVKDLQKKGILKN